MKRGMLEREKLCAEDVGPEAASRLHDRRALSRNRGIINVCEEGVPGTANPSDALTKHLSPKVFKAYMARLYNCLESAI